MSVQKLHWSNSSYVPPEEKKLSIEFGHGCETILRALCFNFSTRNNVDGRENRARNRKWTLEKATLFRYLKRTPLLAERIIEDYFVLAASMQHADRRCWATVFTRRYLSSGFRKRLRAFSKRNARNERWSVCNKGANGLRTVH